jgi:hypothetical protein
MTKETIEKNYVLDMWSGGAPAKHIAFRLNCSTSSVYRITSNAYFNDGDERGGPQSQEARDLWRCNQILEKVAELSGKGVEVSAIGAKLGVKDHIVRASIYLATQAGLNTGFVLGA